MLIAELYEALDELEERTQFNAEIFAEDGDLAVLSTRLAGIGSRAFDLSAAVDQIISALKFSALKFE